MNRHLSIGAAAATSAVVLVALKTHTGVGAIAQVLIASLLYGVVRTATEHWEDTSPQSPEAGAGEY